MVSLVYTSSVMYHNVYICKYFYSNVWGSKALSSVNSSVNNVGMYMSVGVSSVNSSVNNVGMYMSVVVYIG